MLVGTQKSNPYHDEQGRFTTRERAVTLRPGQKVPIKYYPSSVEHEMREQASYLEDQALEHGYHSLDSLVENNPHLFNRLAEKWRRKRIEAAAKSAMRRGVAGLIFGDVGLEVVR